jgi:hypothetical protein
MAIVESYKSSDGMLELEVDFTSGDWTVGFRGYRWHTHGDVLSAWGYEGSPKAAVRSLAHDLIDSRCVIALHKIDGKIHDVSVPDRYVRRPLSKSLIEFAAPGATVELRYWNGQLVAE